MSVKDSGGQGPRGFSWQRWGVSARCALLHVFESLASACWRWGTRALWSASERPLYVRGGEVQVTWSTKWSCTPGLSAVSPTAPVGHWSARYDAEPVPYSKPEQTRFATGSLSLPFFLAAQQQPHGQPPGALHNVQPLGALTCAHHHHRVSPCGVCSSLPWQVMVVSRWQCGHAHPAATVAQGSICLP